MRSYLRLAVGCLALAVIALFAACQASAEGLPSKSKIWAPPSYTPPIDSPPAEVVQAHNFYLGVVGGYTWDQDTGFDDTWHGGLVAGYLFRPSAVLGIGVEADYVARNFGLASGDGVASIRGRMGMFVGQTFLYGTAGIHETWADFMPDNLSRGLVVGGGIERDITKQIAVRAEVLHYRHADDYLGWGDDGSTAGRLGLLFKF